jgi:SpoIID/LytB domain protein
VGEVTAHTPSRALARAIAAALLLAQATCTSASPPPSGGPSSPSATSPSGSGVRSDAVAVAAPDLGSIRVRGTYPKVPSRCVDTPRRTLEARYPGTLSIERSEDGTLGLTLTLPFERYLEGIAEVPPSWPRAALEAQAVAARSYALATTGWSGEQGETLPTPICSTTSCQVYRGMPVHADPAVRRWYRAVQRTAGEVLLFGGRPADTVYFSTSNGHTYGNEDVFGSAPLAYLRPVVERDDGASPTSRWSSRLPFADLATFLGAAGEWPATRRISSVRLDGSTIVVSGDGATRSMASSTFRDAVNAWAPCLEPDRYPPSPLPVTIPSRWMTVSSGPDAATVTGRGWGHGVGMVQWGAYGKALRGWSASEILAYYYGGLRPRRSPEPGLIHVEVASGLTSLRIVPSGPGATLDGGPIGSDTVSVEGGDELTVTTGPR